MQVRFLLFLRNFLENCTLTLVSRLVFVEIQYKATNSFKLRHASEGTETRDIKKSINHNKPYLCQMQSLHHYFALSNHCLYDHLFHLKHSRFQFFITNVKSNFNASNLTPIHLCHQQVNIKHFL